MRIAQFRIRASYPNYYMLKKYVEDGRDVFNRNVTDRDNQLRGNKPGTVRYRLEGAGAESEPCEFPPRWYDMYYLLRHFGEDQERYLLWTLTEYLGSQGIAQGLFSAEEHAEAIARLESEREAFRNELVDYVEHHPLMDNEYVVSSLSQGDYTDDSISHKGHMLLDLTHEYFPVPDFVILTAAGFNRTDILDELIDTAIHNLEAMTQSALGDKENPLVFAIRCAMPQYIPGLMPTLLNIGVTRQAHDALARRYEEPMANRVYLSTLHTLCEMLDMERKYRRNDIALTLEEQRQRIDQMEAEIRRAVPDGDQLLTDAHYQARRLINHVRNFYLNNQDLVLTFMQGKQASPSLILQRMVWTIGNNESYPGVLYSRHSRSGKGRQIESYRNIFGEEIMTGDVTSQDTEYSDRNSIKTQFPAVFHFDPLLHLLEERYKTPVTIEFAVETRPNVSSLFAVLQLNACELTGRAALVSAVDMLETGLIEEGHVVDLIKPYHLRQIVSNSIDEESLSKLQFFGNGLSVLPRSAITCKMCFSVAKARELKNQGESVCLCQERFVPEDTITLNEVDAICSITPAAIHVVTACRGFGIPAFMDLQSYGIGIDIEGKSIFNNEGVLIGEGDTVTFSSKRQAIYLGAAAFRPARFTKYLHNQPVKIEPEEQDMFRDMKHAYEKYQEIITSEEASLVNNIDKLARLIRCDLQGQPDTAKGIVNNWFDANSELFVQQVLQSKMGSHQDLSRVFDLLTKRRKIEMLQRAADICLEQGISGLKAGSFMLGRFVARPLSTKVWNIVSDRHVAFLLNEYVLYEKYLHVLEEVGEIKLARAHSRIETDGIDNMMIRNFDLINFAPLLYSNRSWEQVARELETMDHQENTHLLLEKLSRPVEEVLELDKPWKKAQVDDLLSNANSQ